MTSKLLLSMALSLASSVALQAQILQNDFSTVTAGSYDASTGESFGSATLGNATGQDNITVGASGVDGSAGATARDVSIRSSATSAITTETSFSYYFQFDFNNANEKTGAGFTGAGWALTGGTDGVGNFTGGGDDRFLVGLESTALLGGDPPTGATVNLAYGGRMSSLTNDFTNGGSDVLSTDLTVGNWYQVSFDLGFNYDSMTPGDSTFDVANLSVQDWGTDGLTGGSTVLSLASQTGIGIGTNNGINFENDQNGFAYIGANGQRGAGAGFDNISVVAVPEPSAIALCGLGAIFIFLLGARRRRA